MKMRTRLLIAFLTFSILPIVFAGMLISMNKLFLLYRFEHFEPEVRSMVGQMLISGVFMLVFVSAALTMWVYRSIIRPISKLQEAVRKIRDGNLDFTMDVEEDDEIGQLCQDFEEMRIRLKENAEEKIVDKLLDDKKLIDAYHK